MFYKPKCSTVISLYCELLCIHDKPCYRVNPLNSEITLVYNRVYFIIKSCSIYLYCIKFRGASLINFARFCRCTASPFMKMVFIIEKEFSTRIFSVYE